MKEKNRVIDTSTDSDHADLLKNAGLYLPWDPKDGPEPVELKEDDD